MPDKEHARLAIELSGHAGAAGAAKIKAKAHALYPSMGKPAHAGVKRSLRSMG